MASVTIEFSSPNMADLFMQWMKSGDGEQVLERFAEDYDGAHVSIAVQPKAHKIIVVHTGRIVDDDDPGMNGDEEG